MARSFLLVTALLLLSCCVASVVSQCVAHSAGLTTGLTITTADTRVRSYDLWLPARYSPNGLFPIIFDFHGQPGGTSAGERATTQLTGLADEHGYILVWPQGYNGAFNVGVGCCGDAGTLDIDDVGFVRQLLAFLIPTYCVDTNRVYATGMSAGGFMAHRLGCDANDIIVAISVASGVIQGTCNPARAVPVLDFHGDADTEVLYIYGNGSMEYWLSNDQCNEADYTITYDQGNTQCKTWTSECTPLPVGYVGSTEITFCTISGGIHTWPVPPSIDASCYMINWFKKFAFAPSSGTTGLAATTGPSSVYCGEVGAPAASTGIVGKQATGTVVVATLATVAISHLSDSNGFCSRPIVLLLALFFANGLAA